MTYRPMNRHRARGDLPIDQDCQVVHSLVGVAAGDMLQLAPGKSIHRAQADMSALLRVEACVLLVDCLGRECVNKGALTSAIVAKNQGSRFTGRKMARFVAKDPSDRTTLRNRSKRPQKGV